MLFLKYIGNFMFRVPFTFDIDDISVMLSTLGIGLFVLGSRVALEMQSKITKPNFLWMTVVHIIRRFKNAHQHSLKNL